MNDNYYDKDSYQTYYNGKPYQYQTDTGSYEEKEPSDMSIGRWLLTFLLCAIPVVNLIMLIIWAVGSNPKDAIRKNWARAQLIWMVIITVISTILFIAGGAVFLSVFTDPYLLSQFYEEAPLPSQDDSADWSAAMPDIDGLGSDSDLLPEDSWENMSFNFDGHDYTLPFSYRELEENGWTFNTAEYDYADGYVLNPHQTDSLSVILKNPDYEGLWIGVGFVNDSDVVKDIKDCEIYSFTYDLFGAGTSYPNMDIYGGISIGMSERDAVKLMGDADDKYHSDDYSSYYYNNKECTKYLNFDADKGFGVGYISLSYYIY